MSTQLQSAIEFELAALRPMIQEHGGDIQYISYVNGIVTVKFLGACISCPFSIMTLKMGIERAIRTEVPEIKSVEAVDDAAPAHGTGCC